MTFRYRSSAASDAEACAQIICDWGAETPWVAPIDDPPNVAAAWRDDLAADTSWVAERDGHVVGFCTREQDTIIGFYIARGSRSLGAGAALMTLAKEGQSRLVVWVYELNDRARAFYRREGFVDLGVEKDEHSDLMYVKTLWLRD